MSGWSRTCWERGLKIQGGRRWRCCRNRRCGQARAGRVDELEGHGWDVVSSIKCLRGRKGAVFIPIDLTDYGEVLDAMLGVEERYGRPDALVHLAAVPAPGRVPDHLTFIHNISCTWNVVSAARRAEMTNIVWASSETVLGLPFDTAPPYIPVDEEYAPRPESTYSLVKTLEEAMAVQLCRWNPELKMIGLRFSNVMEPADYARFPSFEDDPVRGSGTCGATSTPATAPRRSVWHWSLI